MEGWEQVTIALAGTHHLFIHANFFLFFFVLGLALFLLLYYFSHFFYFYFLLNRYYYHDVCFITTTFFLLAIIHHCSMLFSSVRTVHIVDRNRRDCTTELQFIAIHQLLNEYAIKRFDASETSRD